MISEENYNETYFVKELIKAYKKKNFSESETEEIVLDYVTKEISYLEDKNSKKFRHLLITVVTTSILAFSLPFAIFNQNYKFEIMYKGASLFLSGLSVFNIIKYMTNNKKIHNLKKYYYFLSNKETINNKIMKYCTQKNKKNIPLITVFNLANYSIEELEKNVYNINKSLLLE